MSLTHQYCVIWLHTVVTFSCVRILLSAHSIASVVITCRAKLQGFCAFLPVLRPLAHFNLRSYAHRFARLCMPSPFIPASLIDKNDAHPFFWVTIGPLCCRTRTVCVFCSCDVTVWTVVPLR